jgi:hypothetical protein
MAAKNSSKKKIDQVVQNKPFLCASFDDGYMVVHTTWIKEKINESCFDVYFPKKNASNLVSKNIPKENIILWDSMAAIIECSHGTLLNYFIFNNILYFFMNLTSI